MESWWRSGILYQIYPRSFADTDGDGVGDLRGVTEHLDHLAWLGIDGIWLNPITPSPNADWGYDVSDYTAVDPAYGDMKAFDELIARSTERGIRVVLDLVPNHTSDRHPWFVDARSGPHAAHRNWYVWADPRQDGSPPNNWRSVFGGPAWTLDRGTGQYHLHNFLAQQPDLNWWEEGVREAFDEILRFWFDRGVAGFRIDVANGLVKDRDLRDNPPVTDEDDPRIRALGVRSVYNMNRPEVHDVYRRWRKIADEYDPTRILLGETWILELEALVRFYGEGTDELDLAVNFPFLFADFGAGTRSVVDATEALIQPDAWPTWGGSNHDVGRFPTRWCGDDDTKARAALLMLLTLRGTPLLYYGDEIGMTEVAITRDRILDPVGLRGWPDDPGRDPGRTPMQWTADPTGGFTGPGVDPWLPVGDPARCNVADQRGDTGSMLNLCRDLIAVRRSRPDLQTGTYATVDGPEGLWMWRRGGGTMVAVNCSDHPVDADLTGRVLVGTRRDRDGDPVGPGVRLEPWEALVADV
jgi:alpha-glucosidase